MRKRLLLALLFGVGLSVGVGIAGGSSAQASTTAERIAAHRAEVQARIACAMQNGGSCGGAPAVEAAATPTSAAPVQTSAAPARQRPIGGSGKLIEVSISEQKLRAWEGDQVVMEAPVSTGRPGYETPTGQYSILGKERSHWSTQYHVHMPYAMRVVRGIYIHETPISPDGQRLGRDTVGVPVSAGCIRVPEGFAARLYEWTPVGAPVYIH